MALHHTINYLELPARELEATKAFFQAVFGWGFVDYGPDYSCFTQAGIDGGFFPFIGELRYPQWLPAVGALLK